MCGAVYDFVWNKHQHFIHSLSPLPLYSIFPGKAEKCLGFFVCLIFSCHNLKPWSFKLGSDFSVDLVPELSGVSGRDSEPRWTLVLCTRHLPSPLKPVTASFCSFKMLTQSHYFHRNVREWLESPDPTVCTCNLLDHMCCFPGWFSLIFT